MKLQNKRSLPNRKALRLKGHDYSSAGYYFLTICCQNRECLFGKIENGEMILNDAGKMVEKWYYELENKYSDKRCHEMVIMPNHIHCIIENILTAHDALQRDAHDACQNENDNENLMDALQRDAHETCQNENDNENLMDALQRDAHEKRGRPVDKNQCFTNGQIDDHEKRGRPVDKNQCFTNGKIDLHSMNASKKAFLNSTIFHSFAQNFIIMKTFLIFLLFLLGFKLGCTQEISIESSNRIKINYSIEDKKYSIVDKFDNSKIFISNLDSVVHIYTDYLYFVKRNNKWGIFSETGSEIRPIEYDSIIKVDVSTWIVHLNNKKGIFTTSPHSKNIDVSYDDLFFTNKTGAEYLVSQNDKYGIVNKLGNEIVPIEYDLITMHKNALILNKGNQKSFLIGIKIFSEEVLIEKSFRNIISKKENEKYYFVYKTNGKQGVIDNNCNIIVEPRYHDISIIGLTKCGIWKPHLIVQNESGLCGLFDLNGNPTIPIQYKSIDVIDSTYAILKKDSLFFFHNYLGNVSESNSNFDSYEIKYRSNYINVFHNKKMNLADKREGFKLLFPFIYDNIYEDGDYFVVRINDLFGVVDKENRFIIPIEYQSIKLYCNNFIVSKNNKYGILSPNNEIKIPLDYILISPDQEKILLFKTESSNEKVINCDLNCIKNCD